MFLVHGSRYKKISLPFFVSFQARHAVVPRLRDEGGCLVSRQFKNDFAVALRARGVFQGSFRFAQLIGFLDSR
jgi:hypothetical protein